MCFGFQCVSNVTLKVILHGTGPLKLLKIIVIIPFFSSAFIVTVYYHHTVPDIALFIHFIMDKLTVKEKFIS